MGEGEEGVVAGGSSGTCSKIVLFVKGTLAFGVESPPQPDIRAQMKVPEVIKPPAPNLLKRLLKELVEIVF